MIEASQAMVERTNHKNETGRWLMASAHPVNTQDDVMTEGAENVTDGMEFSQDEPTDARLAGARENTTMTKNELDRGEPRKDRRVDSN